MELTHLRYFRAIARSGSMMGAARELHVSQPTLSVSVRNLEEELGTTLFLRGPRGVQLTHTGRELLVAADRVFDVLEEATMRIHGLETDDVGHFVLGCPEALGAYFVPRFLHAFMANAPRVEITLWNGPSPAVHRAVIEREVQFGILVNPLPHPDLTLIPLFEDATDLHVAGAPEDDPIPAAEARVRLSTGPLVYVDGLPQTRELLRLLSEGVGVPERRVPCGDLEMVKSLAIAGVGVAIIPRRVASYGRPGSLRRLHPDLPFVPDTIFLAYRGDIHRTRAALRLKDALVKHGKQL